ncbi:SDR family NAD(P)-dependent oxidoreductase [Flavivirga eckloniae]|uniref:Short-chain dehydrogenase n=1 Tax=Flavivirga eckloniae TaxID=1803846 RepID=A0A2K9PTC9_9FLAO|nr:SDR family oxidoreductase [Flavivirga eckloniae]AUP80068.1 short-chain dehydrogenase [Flavivirga eckloniae]
MKRLQDKIAIITGAADGIGLAISKVFAKEGAIVVMGDINFEKCQQEADAISKNIGKAIAKKCDVGHTKEVNELINQTLKTYGKIDVLINNAAVAISGNITEMPEEDWDKVINTNLKSVYRTIKAVLPIMLKQHSGSVINMSSTQAFRSWDNWTAYAGAKGAILSMTNQLAGQFGDRGVRFNTISPGAIMTPLNQKRVETEGDGFLNASRNMSPMNRMGTANEVAMTALFLASDEAKFITGEDIKIDGGLCTLPRYVEE